MNWKQAFKVTGKLTTTIQIKIPVKPNYTELIKDTFKFQYNKITSDSGYLMSSIIIDI